jgi:hypothetical protein
MKVKGLATGSSVLISRYFLNPYKPAGGDFWFCLLFALFLEAFCGSMSCRAR